MDNSQTDVGDENKRLDLSVLQQVFDTLYTCYCFSKSTVKIDEIIRTGSVVQLFLNCPSETEKSSRWQEAGGNVPAPQKVTATRPIVYPVGAF